MNVSWALHLVEQLSQSVEHAVICPGSRSSPLAMALEHHPDVTTHVAIDERGGAYFALGIGRATGRPAVVLTTSGTAVANLLPAAAEAHHANVPLILLTADRPEELRGTGANQTMDQVGLFSRFVRAEADLPHPRDGGPALEEHLRLATAWPPGPVHLNQPLRKPLEPDQAEQRLLAALAGRPRRRHASSPLARPTAEAPELALRGRGILVLGPHTDPEAGLRAAELAASWRVPVLADALSGMRFGPHGACDAYDLYLGCPKVQQGLRPDWVLQFGRSPTSAALHAFLAAHRGPRHLVDASGRGWSDIPGDVTVHACDGLALLERVDAAGVEPWEAPWPHLEEHAQRLADEALQAWPEAEAAWVRALEAERLFVGNSMPVRDLERFGRSPQPMEVHANRGVSGIDGTIATAAGIAAAAGPTTAVIGDVAFQHDAGSLALAPDDLRLWVIDNGGGRIFHHLPVDGTPHFERLFLTPPRIDIEKACAAFALDVERVPVSGAARATAQVVVLDVDGERSARWRQALQRRVHTEVAGLLSEAA